MFEEIIIYMKFWDGHNYVSRSWKVPVVHLPLSVTIQVLLMLADGEYTTPRRGLFFTPGGPGDVFRLQVRPAPCEISILSQIFYRQGR